MKSILILFLFFSFGFTVNAQVWIDSGAVWHYNHQEMWGFKGYSIMRYDSDTLIQNHLCQKITSEHHGFMWESTDVYVVSGVSNSVVAHTYVNGDTVFYLAPDGEFRVLLNFGAQIGDTWDISYDDDGDSTTQDTTRVVVVETGTSNGNRYIEIDMATCSHGWFQGRFDERYGYMWSEYYSPSSPFPHFFLGCNGIYCGGGTGLCSYSDARGQLHGISGESCEFPGIKILGTSEAETFNFQVFPNPIKDNFRITGLLDMGIDAILVDVSGKKVMELTNVLNNQLIDVSELKSGIYILQLSVDGTVETKKIVIQ